MTKRLGFVFRRSQGGVPLTDFFTTEVPGSHTNTNRYIIGPTAELHLPLGFGVEVDALYRHMGYVGGSPHPLEIWSTRTPRRDS